LLEEIKEGYDVVCGWRHNRRDPRGKLIVSKIFYIIHRAIFKVGIHDPGCTLRIFKRGVLENIYLFNGAHRFFTTIVFKLGYKIQEIKVMHFPRSCGKSKYNIHNRIFGVIKCLILLSLFDIHILMNHRKQKC
jgi:hypothetical protein